MTNATMTNSNTDRECPDQDTLTDFLNGKLVPPALETCESHIETCQACLLYTSPSPRDQRGSRMPSSA